MTPVPSPTPDGVSPTPYSPPPSTTPDEDTPEVPTTPPGDDDAGTPAPSSTPAIDATETPAQEVTATPAGEPGTPAPGETPEDDITPTPAMITPTPMDVTPTPMDVTPTPFEATPSQSTPTPDDVTPTPEEATPTPLEATPTPAQTTPTPIDPTATPAEPTPTPPPTPRYQATIRRTSHGVVHVLADDLGSAAFGEGYAFAQAHACILADQIVKVRSERSYYFGAGTNDANLDNDFGYLALNVYQYAEDGIQDQSDEARALLAGYAAGYNQYLEDVGPSGLPDDCAGADWVKPITETDLLAYHYSAALLASGSALIPYIARAQPPGSSSNGSAELLPLPDFRSLEMGSNGWALGGERTANGRGMLAANPHFPWEGENKLFESHLTVPGQLNVYGASLMGIAVINIGFNDDIAWTHTVSSASRVTLYRLSLTPGDPTKYRYDKETRQITGTTYTVEVKQPDGSIAKVSRQLYRSHYGPMITFEGAGWSTTQGFSFRDANENNPALLQQFLEMALAPTLAAFESVHETVHGIPWVYTMATDREGNALFMDSSEVPNLSQDTLADWQEALETDPLVQGAWESGIPLLDGSTSQNEWVVDPEAPIPGVIPLSEAPVLERADYVANANDSHWLTNPAEPLEGYSPLYGAERTPRSPRTRMNLRFLTETGDNAACGSDGRFTLDELLNTMFSDRAMIAELLLAQVAQRCAGVSTYVYDGTTVDISEACALLTAWDGRSDLDSVGAIVWREFLGGFEYDQLLDAGELFKLPFDPENPIDTPNTLAAAPIKGSDPILENLAAAVERLAGTQLELDTPLGEAQYTLKGETRIPLHGGQSREGAFNTLNYSSSLNSTLLPRMSQAEVINSDTDLTTEGYLVNYGTSFVMGLEFNENGPRARALISYSQSDDDDSPYYADQTWLFSEKAWRDVAFSEEDIAADPELEVFEVSGGAP